MKDLNNDGETEFRVTQNKISKGGYKNSPNIPLYSGNHGFENESKKGKEANSQSLGSIGGKFYNYFKLI